jgi:hypothetical protein
MYIGGLKVGALRANLMTNWQANKYDSLIALHNDVAKNSLWRSAAVNNPRNSISATTHIRGKAHAPLPSYKSPHGSIGRSSHGSHNIFGGNESEGAFGSKLTWGHLKDAKAYF